ncbi:hypothetical protein KKC36_01675 [Patescibacteria group bacterium]|nr:hypothetical protein [Patescibacteria group bacterium]
MSPEQIASTNMWELFEGESIEATDGRTAKGPLSCVRVESVLEEENLMSVQLPDGSKYELKGTDFAKAVKKDQSK